MWVACLLVFVALLPLEYKFHSFIDFYVGIWVITIYFFDLISYNFLNIIIALVFLALSVGVEVVWFLLYPNNWWNSVYVDDGSLINARRYTYYVSIVSFAVKGIFGIILLVSLFLVEKTKTYQTPTNIGTRG